MFGGDDSIVYWRCECGQTLQEKLQIPVINRAREQALVIAAKQVYCVDLFMPSISTEIIMLSLPNCSD